MPTLVLKKQLGPGLQRLGLTTDKVLEVARLDIELV